MRLRAGTIREVVLGVLGHESAGRMPGGFMVKEASSLPSTGAQHGWSNPQALWSSGSRAWLGRRVAIDSADHRVEGNGIGQL